MKNNIVLIVGGVSSPTTLKLITDNIKEDIGISVEEPVKNIISDNINIIIQ